MKAYNVNEYILGIIDSRMATKPILYSTANDRQPQMIPKIDRKWSSTASDPQSRPQMIPKEK